MLGRGRAKRGVWVGGDASLRLCGCVELSVLCMASPGHSGGRCVVVVTCVGGLATVRQRADAHM